MYSRMQYAVEVKTVLVVIEYLYFTCGGREGNTESYVMLPLVETQCNCVILLMRCTLCSSRRFLK